MSNSPSLAFPQIPDFRKNQGFHSGAFAFHNRGQVDFGRAGGLGLALGLEKTLGDSPQQVVPGIEHLEKNTALAKFESTTLLQSSATSVQISARGFQLSYQSQSYFESHRVSYDRAFPEKVQNLSRTEQAVAAQSAQTSADNILGFIEKRVKSLTASGANTEELQRAFDQGLEGFIKGRDEAIEILKGYGLYDDSIAQGVAETTELVNAGIEDLRAKYLGDGTEQQVGSVDDSVEDESSMMPPVAPVVVPAFKNKEASQGDSVDVKAFETTAVEHAVEQGGRSRPSRSSSLVASYRERIMASEAINLEVKTRDGDVVTLSLDAIRGYQAQAELGAFYQQGEQGKQFVGVANTEAYVFAESNFNIQVDGDLDDGEVAALQDLLAQVSDLAETFFSGDIAKAFKQAQKFNLDTRELMSMSLDMTRTQTVSVASAYESVADLGSRGRDSQGDGSRGHGHKHNNHHHAHQALKGLGNYMNELLESLQTASAFSEPKDLINGLFASYLASLDVDAEDGPPIDAEQLQRVNEQILDTLIT